MAHQFLTPLRKLGLIIAVAVVPLDARSEQGKGIGTGDLVYGIFGLAAISVVVVLLTSVIIWWLLNRITGLDRNYWAVCIGFLAAAFLVFFYSTDPTLAMCAGVVGGIVIYFVSGPKTPRDNV